MAIASGRVAVNPKLISTPSPQGNELVKVRAADSKTWNKGEFGHYSSGTVQPNTTTTGAKIVRVQFAETQATATSTSDVWVRILEDGAEFEVYVKADSADTDINQADVGTVLGIYTASNISYVDTSDAAGQFEVRRIASQYEPELNAVADTPGKCIVRYREMPV